MELQWKTSSRPVPSNRKTPNTGYNVNTSTSSDRPLPDSTLIAGIARPDKPV
jgi:hypothetical protein